MKADEVERFRKQYSNTGVYTTAYRYENQDQAGLIWADFLYMDFDDQRLASPDTEVANEAWDCLQEDLRYAITHLHHLYGLDPKQDMRFFFSGKKGLSLLISPIALGYSPDENLNIYFKAIAEDIRRYVPHGTLDLSIYDRKRLWRLVNSKHEATGLFKIPLTMEEARTEVLADVQALARNPREMEYPTSSKKREKVKPRLALVLGQTSHGSGMVPTRPLSYTPPCVTFLEENGVDEGQRNVATAALANFYQQAGYQMEEIIQRMKEWNSNHCQPPLSGQEVERTARSAVTGSYQWGCATFRDISVCDRGKCRLK